MREPNFTAEIVRNRSSWKLNERDRNGTKPHHVLDKDNSKSILRNGKD